MTLLVGTCGWQYADWRGDFYPPRLPQSRWLEHYSRELGTVEIDSTFYRLPSRATFERWAAATPEGFAFSVKASRYLTHVKRLADPDPAVEHLLERARGLGRKLAVVLLQLPPTLRGDVGRLAGVLAAFADRVPIALEPRHPSWFCEEVYAQLRAANAALCWTDRRNVVGPLVRTADWCYVRLHEGTAAPPGNYGRQALRNWVDRVERGYGPRPSGFAYFNNDAGGCAVRNAATLRRRYSASGGARNR